MGAFYMSCHFPDVPPEAVRAEFVAFNASATERIAAFLAPAVGRWTALYPQFSPTSDAFAKHASMVFSRVVVTLASPDEDSFICNVCVNGKDLSFFKINAMDRRTGKKREAVEKKLEHLAGFIDEAAVRPLVDRLCDTREVKFGSDIMRDFCRVAGIKNACSCFDYIDARDHEADFDVVVHLERIG